MSTIFLRFPDEPAFAATLAPDFMAAGETGYPLPDGVSAISVIGDHPATVGNASSVAGYLVNMVGAIPSAWAPYVIAPATPIRIFGVTP